MDDDQDRCPPNTPFVQGRCPQQHRGLLSQYDRVDGTHCVKPKKSLKKLAARWGKGKQPWSKPICTTQPLIKPLQYWELMTWNVWSDPKQLLLLSPKCSSHRSRCEVEGRIQWRKVLEANLSPFGLGKVVAVLMVLSMILGALAMIVGAFVVFVLAKNAPSSEETPGAPAPAASSEETSYDLETTLDIDDVKVETKIKFTLRNPPTVDGFKLSQSHLEGHVEWQSVVLSKMILHEAQTGLNAERTAAISKAAAVTNIYKRLLPDGDSKQPVQQLYAEMLRWKVAASLMEHMLHAPTQVKKLLGRTESQAVTAIEWKQESSCWECKIDLSLLQKGLSEICDGAINFDDVSFSLSDPCGSGMALYHPCQSAQHNHVAARSTSVSLNKAPPCDSSMTESCQRVRRPEPSPSQRAGAKRVARSLSATPVVPKWAAHCPAATGPYDTYFWLDDRQVDSRRHCVSLPRNAHAARLARHHSVLPLK
jgi:hypothetical protein